MKKRLYLLLALLSLFTACRKLLPQPAAEEDLLDGPVEGLTHEQNARFLSGDRAFNDEVFTPETGLGPLFVSTSCGSCHAGDGKGHPFSTLTRFGQSDTVANAFLRNGGPQLQHRAIAGCLPEALPAGASFSKNLPPANTGLGFLEAVPDAALLALADPQDANGDGISGRPNWIRIPHYVAVRDGSVTQGERYIGRFGKKAFVYNLLQQTAGAYNQDMGITSTFEPVDTYTGHATDPEVTDATIQDVVFYLQTLKAPIQRNADNADVQAGSRLFVSLNCGGCHTPTLTTGASPIAALAGKTVHPYTDLLLHDMGPGLDDGYTEGTALTSEWRTPALWGLGLSPASQGGQYFLLHDGRARSIAEAIELHGGEAQRSRDRYMQLSTDDRQKLIRFLESL